MLCVLLSLKRLSNMLPFIGFPLCCFVKLVNQGISVELMDMVERLTKEHYKNHMEQRFK